MLMGGRVEGLACADLGARTPIDVSGNFSLIFSILNLKILSIGTPRLNSGDLLKLPSFLDMIKLVFIHRILLGWL